MLSISMEKDIIDLLKEIYMKKYGKDYHKILSSDIKFVREKYNVSQPEAAKMIYENLKGYKNDWILFD
ncbi:hypothetical protein [Flexistipes sinusarabici]|uniref:hypothetical protein n=1 Tax=Flexistipes sinusarabici TaxID=2352 RepID=UPI002354DC68|nr:hypothetical protein [Flexistipes sinusarabici]